MTKRVGRKSASQTPAPKSDKIYGSKKNPKGSASSEKSAKSIKLSEQTEKVLKNKLSEFKEEHPNKKSVTLSDLKAVYRRGSGAYSNSHRPTITGGAPNSRAAWSYASALVLDHGRYYYQVTGATAINTMTLMASETRLVIQAGAGGITVNNSGDIGLKGAVNATIPAFYCIEFMATGTNWIELSRNF